MASIISYSIDSNREVLLKLPLWIITYRDKVLLLPKFVCLKNRSYQIYTQFNWVNLLHHYNIFAAQTNLLHLSRLSCTLGL